MRNCAISSGAARAGTTRFLARRSTMRACCRLVSTMTKFRRLRSRSEEHTSELQSLMRISYAVFCLKKKKKQKKHVQTPKISESINLTKQQHMKKPIRTNHTYTT